MTKKVKTSVSEEEKAALVAWHAIGGVGEGTVKKLVAEFGSGREAWRAKTQRLKALLTTRSLEEHGARRNRGCETWYEPLVKAGVTVWVWGEANYPTLLAQATESYPLVYMRGSISEADARAVAVVGTRKPTDYGKTVTRDIVSGLVGEGFTIISGLAYGIDGVAHAAALEASGRTVAVLAGDTRRPTPVAHGRLADHIIEQGALVSAYSPYKTVMAGQFVARDRVMAGLALGVLVTEGTGDSGALHTARFGREMKRPVMAVPGPITSLMSAAPTALLKTGAKVVTGAVDVVETLGLGLQTKRVGEGSSFNIESITDPGQKEIVTVLAREGQMNIDGLGKLTGLGPETVSSALTMLEIEGVVEQANGVYRLGR